MFRKKILSRGQDVKVVRGEGPRPTLLLRLCLQNKPSRLNANFVFKTKYDRFGDLEVKGVRAARD